MLVRNDLAIARAVHVLAVVIWIGGVGMVTTVILPVVRARCRQRAQALLEAVELHVVGKSGLAGAISGHRLEALQRRPLFALHFGTRDSESRNKKWPLVGATGPRGEG